MKNISILFSMALTISFNISGCVKDDDVKCCIDDLNSVRKPQKIILLTDDIVSSIFPSTTLRCLQADGSDFGPQVKNWTMQ